VSFLDESHVLGSATLVFAAAAATIVLVFLVKRPPLGSATKAWLFFGIGVLPIAAAFTGNVAGYQVSKRREFCASCHPMAPYVQDAADVGSTTLASFHSRNRHIGDESCYTCHRDYRWMGGIVTKLVGMRHLWAYYTKYAWAKTSLPLRLYRPFPSTNCKQCHSMRLPGFRDEPEHAAVAGELAASSMSCVESGCHGPAHPKKGASP
jgi:cytochrome c-type protein NapC